MSAPPAATGAISPGARAARLSTDESARAWQALAAHLEALGDADLPKFKDLLAAIRAATLEGKKCSS